MKGASIACQFPGKPGGLGGGLAGRLRLASEYSLVSSVESFPVEGSMRSILIPVQKLPKLSQARPFSSMMRLGSMALKSSPTRDCRTKPRSIQRKFELEGSSVLLVSRAMPEVFLPNTEKA